WLGANWAPPEGLPEAPAWFWGWFLSLGLLSGALGGLGYAYLRQWRRFLAVLFAMAALWAGSLLFYAIAIFFNNGIHQSAEDASTIDSQRTQLIAGGSLFVAAALGTAADAWLSARRRNRQAGAHNGV